MLSVVLTAYNKPKELKVSINSILSQTYKDFELIISDDCSTTDIKTVVDSFDSDRIKYVNTGKNSGYIQNSIFGLREASGKYVTFMCDDDKLIDDNYFKDAIDLIENQNADMVFARLIQNSPFGIHYNEYDFKESYDFESLLNIIEDMRFNYHDYFVFGACIFLRDKFLAVQPFKSMFKDAATTDITNITKYALSSNKIACLNRPVYDWKRPDSGSLSGSRKDDITFQIINHLAFPLDMYAYLEEKGIELTPALKDFLNKRAGYSFYAMLSDYEAVENNENFATVAEKLNNVKDDVYIYCKGWIGLELERFLSRSGIKVAGFIDDYKKDENVISSEKFFSTERRCTVIIANYKYKDLYLINKKFKNMNHVTVLDLYR